MDIKMMSHFSKELSLLETKVRNPLSVYLFVIFMLIANV